MMCLDTVYKGKEKKNALAALPKSGYYWKVVRFRNDRYYPLFQNKYKVFRIGNNKTKPKYAGLGYKIAYHIFRTKKVAQKYLGDSSIGNHKKVVRCRIKKADIIAVGFQSIHIWYRRTRSYLQYNLLTFVTSRFWMPKPS